MGKINLILWNLIRKFRKNKEGSGYRSKVHDSLVVIGVTQAMLLGMLSTEEGSSCSGKSSKTDLIPTKTRGKFCDI